jgi:hypothetical protein
MEVDKMAFYIECGNCVSWTKGKKRSDQGVCGNKDSDNFNKDVFDSQSCDCFVLRDE